MKPLDIEILIQGLTFVQKELQQRSNNDNGSFLKHYDIDELQRSIEILKVIKTELEEEDIVEDYIDLGPGFESPKLLD